MKRILFFVTVFCLFSSCSKEKRSDVAAGKMQDFVSNISKYARNLKPGFIIIPQNGIELAFKGTDPGEGFDENYMNAIDGIGVEELFYNGNYSLDGDRLSMLQELKSSKKIFVSEFVKDDANIADAITLNTEQGFLCFPRNSTNYDYLQIPAEIQSPNSGDITQLADAQNYLYLISTDNFQSKQEMLDAISATDFDLVLIDLFFNEVQLTESEVTQLKTKADGGKRLVIAYMNIGSAEKFRYYWGKNWGLHHPLWLKRKYEGYSDEFWVKFWKDDWQNIIFGNNNSYTKKIIDSGFDGAYLDNVEAYYFVYYKD